MKIQKFILSLLIAVSILAASPSDARQRGQARNLNNYSMLTVEQIQALALTPTWQENAPKAGSQTIPAALAPFPSAGWALVRFYSTAVGGGVSQNPFTIDDGSAANQFTFRVFTDDKIRFRMLKGSVDYGNVTALRSDYTLQANIIKTVVITWNGSTRRQAFLIDGDYDENTAAAADFTGWTPTTLRIGSRNGGADPLTGAVVYAEIGTTELTKAQMAARAYAADTLTIVAAGQSNKANDFSATFSAAGRNAISSSFASTGREAIYINGAAGGTSVLLANDAGSGSWWNETTDAPGSALLNLYNVIQPLGIAPDVILWAQGEADSFGAQSKTTYKTYLLRVFNHMRATYPNVRIGIQKLGRRTGAFNGYTQYQSIAEVQKEIYDTYDWAFLASEVYDLTMSDAVHLDTSAYTTAGTRNGNSIKRAFGAAVTGGTKGPRLVSATRSVATVTATIEHDAGTDFTPTTGIEGFKWFDGAITRNLTDKIKTSASSSTVTLNIASHGLSVGSRVNFPTTVTYNGITLLGGYSVVSVTDADNVTVLTRGGAATATDSTGGGGAISFTTEAYIAPSSAVRASATTLTVTLGSTPVTTPGTLYYNYDAFTDLVSAANIIVDNGANALPMRRGSVTVN